MTGPPPGAPIGIGRRSLAPTFLLSIHLDLRSVQILLPWVRIPRFAGPPAASVGTGGSMVAIVLIAQGFFGPGCTFGGLRWINSTDRLEGSRGKAGP